MICAWAIYTAVSSVGAKCFPNENPQFQFELRRGVARLDAYVLRNSKNFTDKDVAEFKKRQGHTDTAAAQLCQGDAVTMYRMIERAGVGQMNAGIDKLLERDGPPSWGTCL